MINSMTVVLCNKLCAFGIFPKSQEKIYIYGFELLLSSVIGIVVLVMISITRGTAFAWLSYLLGFIPVRITGGGYHAKTHFTCILSFSLVFLIFLLSSSFIDIQSITYIFLSLTTLIISLAVAPVEAINKPLSNERRSKNRKRCLRYATINQVIALVIWAVRIPCGAYISLYFFGEFAAGISMIVSFKTAIPDSTGNKL